MILWNIVGRFLAFSKFFGFFDPPQPLSTFLKLSKKSAQKWPKNSQKKCLFLAKNTKMGEMCFRPFPVVGKCCKLRKLLIFVEKSEKIIKIGPDTAEIPKKQLKNGLKYAKFGGF